jgi:hypothetical protein
MSNSMDYSGPIHAKIKFTHLSTMYLYRRPLTQHFMEINQFGTWHIRMARQMSTTWVCLCNKTHAYKLPSMEVMNHLKKWPKDPRSTGLCFYNTVNSGSADTCHQCTVTGIYMWEHRSQSDTFLCGSLSHKPSEVSHLVHIQPDNKNSLPKLW